jgi:hypothetical protein
VLASDLHPKPKQEQANVILFRFLRGLAEYSFKVAGWCVLIGAVKYLSEKSENRFLVAVYYYLIGAMGLLFSVFFVDIFETYLRPMVPLKKWGFGLQIAVSVAISYALLLGVILIATELVQAFANAHN